MNYSKINTFDICNGDGIRVSLFVSGCNFHCQGCFNQEAQDFNYGHEYTDKVKKYILNKVNQKDFSGLSILGGDPLCQSEEGLKELIELCVAVHSLGKDIWLWSGYKWEDIWSSNDTDSFLRKTLIDNVDYFVDGQYIEQLKDLSSAFKGSTNQRIIDVQNSRKEKEITIKEIE